MLNITLQNGTTVRDNDFQNAVSKMESKWEFRRRTIVKVSIWRGAQILLTMDCKEIQPVHPKGDQSWVFTGRTDVEAETPILWSPDVKS